MAWNPDIYEKFKDQRSAPFYDLVKLLHTKSDLTVIDLGCGTGELTSKLLDYLEDSKITGIDSSAEMLLKSEKFQTSRLQFFKKDIEEQLKSDEKFDIIFSNAVLHWLPDHANLFPEIISKLNPDGQLAIQLPSNHTFTVHRLLAEVMSREPFQSASQNYQREVPVLKIEDYAKILHQNGGDGITVFEKVYPHVMQDADALFDWASGTAMLPYLEHLPENLHEDFKNQYKEALRQAFQDSPVFYPFKRILMYARFGTEAE